MENLCRAMSNCTLKEPKKKLCRDPTERRLIPRRVLHELLNAHAEFPIGPAAVKAIDENFVVPLLQQARRHLRHAFHAGTHIDVSELPSVLFPDPIPLARKTRLIGASDAQRLLDAVFTPFVKTRLSFSTSELTQVALAIETRLAWLARSIESPNVLAFLSEHHLRLSHLFRHQAGDYVASIDRRF